MDYIVNDIENILLLNDIGVYDIIQNECDSLSITNIRVNDFSIQMQRKISVLYPKGLVLIEIELDFYEFEIKYEKELLELGDGDRSTVYEAFVNDKTVITNSPIIFKTCKKFNLNVVYIEDFIVPIVNDRRVLDFFKSSKIP